MFQDIRYGLLAGVTLAALMSSLDAVAQEAPPATESASSIESAAATSSVEEVVVTARRREERLLDVPASVSALSSSELEARSITNTQELQSFVPGLKFTAQVSNETPNFIIRGQGRPLFVGALPAVVVYVNDVPLPQDGSTVSLYDMASVQVLKGPQGTLFGRNSTGGAVLLYPQRPQQGEFSGYIKAAVGNYNLRHLVGGVTVPLIGDKLALRVAGELLEHDGYIKNLSGGPDLDDRNRKSVRATLLWEPTENITSLTAIDYTNIDETGTGAVVFGNFGTGVLYGSSLAPYFVSGVPGSDLNYEIARHKADGPRTARPGLKPLSKADSWGAVNDTKINIGAVTVRNIFGYRRNKTTSVYDVDGTPLTINARQNAFGAYPQINLEQFSNETQVLGNAFDDKLSYILGVFVLDERPAGINAGQSAAAVTPTSPPPAITSTYMHTKSKAVFGQVSYDFSALVPGLTLTAGLRYTKDDRTFCVIQRTTVASEDECGPIRVGTRYEEPTYTLSAEYKPFSNLLLYAVTRRGYRGGGVNTNLSTTAPIATYQPETNTDYEVGVKGSWRWGEASFQLTAAAFHQDIEDLQSSLPVTLVSANGSLFNGAVVLNAAKASADGFEIAATIAPTANLALDLTYEGFFGSFDEYTGPPEFVATLGALTNTRFNTPPHAFGARVRYTVPAELPGRLRLSANYRWVDDNLVSAAPLVPHPDLMQPAYSLVDLRADWEGAFGDQIDLAVFANNVTDELYRIGSGSGVPTLTVNSTIYGEPRTYGVEIKYHF